mgnify:FL=1
MRKQVQLDLGTPALRPTAARGGQYSVAVQATPKTNSALQLAQALRRTPQVLGQATNIAKDLGAEAAASTMDVEAAMNDTETKGILGYDKAYQQGLVKRHFVMNEESIKERFMGLSRTDDSLKQTPEEFIATMEGERQAFADELLDQFGGNGNREQAIQALTGTFVDTLRDEATGAWVDNKKDQAFMQLSADTSDIIKKQGAAAGLKHAQAEINAWALDLKPSEKAAKLRGIVTADAAVLAGQGKLSQAEALLKEASSYSLHGNAKLFGSAEGKKEITLALKSIRSAREKSEVSFSDNSKGLGRSVDALLQDVANPDVTTEERTASALRMAKRAGVSDEDAQAFAEAASAGGIDAMMEAYRDLARNSENETTRDLLNDQLGEINRAKKEYFGGNASTIGTFSSDDIADLKAQREAILREDPNTPLTQLPTSVNGRKMNVEDDDYKALLREERLDFGWATSPSQLNSITRDTRSAITGTDNAGAFGAYASEYGTAIKNDLNAEAPALWRKAKYDVAEYDALLQDKAEKLFDGYKRRAELRGSTESILDTNLSSAKETEAQEEAYNIPDDDDDAEKTPRKTVRDLPSFSSTDVSVSDIMNDRKTLANMETGRRSVSTAAKRRLLQASLMDYGFPTMDSLDLELLSDADMGFEDVILGDAVIREMLPAFRGYQAKQLLEDSRNTLDSKDIKNLEKIIKDAQGSIEKWMDYGFDSVEDFNRLEEAQEALRNLNNR